MISISAQNPYLLIAEFANKYHLLNEDQKKNCIFEICNLFSENAFKGNSIKIPEEYLEQFETSDLSFFLKHISSVPERLRVLANIEQVSKKLFKKSSSKYPGVQIQIEQKNKQGEVLCHLWGRIQPEFLANPPSIGDLKNPSQLLALQQLQYNTLSAIDLPIECMNDLFSYAIEFKLQALENMLLAYYKQLNDNEFEKFSNHIVKYLEKSDVFNSLKNIRRKLTVTVELSPSESDALKLFNSNINESPNKNRKKKVKELEKIKGNSPWFNKDKPFESIAHFTNRFFALSREAQKCFFKTAYDFFSEAEEPLKIPENLKERFAKIDLPFLLTHVNESDSDNISEKDRLVAKIQMLTKLHFSSLGPNQVHCIHTEPSKSSSIPNINMGWLRDAYIQNSPLKKSLVEQGFFAVDSIELKTMSRNLFNAFQKIQYNFYPEGSSSILSPKKLKDLLFFSFEYSLKPLAAKICDTILNIMKGENYEMLSTLIAKKLHQESIFNSLVSSDFGLLKPHVNKLNDEQLLDVLKFNFTRLGRLDLSLIIRFSLGNPIKFDILGKFFSKLQEGPQKNDLKKYFIENLYSQIEEKVDEHQWRFLKGILQFEKEEGFLEEFNSRVSTWSRSEMDLKNLYNTLTQKDIDGYLTEIRFSKSRDLLLGCILDKYPDMKTNLVVNFISQKCKDSEIKPFFTTLIKKILSSTEPKTVYEKRYFLAQNTKITKDILAKCCKILKGKSAQELFARKKIAPIIGKIVAFLELDTKKY